MDRKTTRMRVGVWTVTPSQNRLQHERRTVKIDPRAMDVLVHLANHAGDVVSADELIDAVWEGRVVGDGAVYQAIAQLRRALAADTEQAHYIETIPKRGYRLVAPVTRPPDEPGRDAASNRTKSPYAFKLGLAGVGVLLVSLGIGWFLLDPARQEPEPFVAVLPFENLSSDPDDAIFFSGMHTDLLTQLAKVRSLRVISRTSVLEYQGNPRNLRQIGAELGVAAVLEGSAQRVGETVRLNVQLIDANTDEHLWAESFDWTLAAEDTFAIQRQIATSIARALQATLTVDDIARLEVVPTRSSRAYDFYLSGNDYLNRPDDRRFLPLALQQYTSAVEEDPDFALAWAALSRAHSLAYWYSIDRTPSRRDMALAAADRALALQPDLPEGHLALSLYHYQGFHDYDAALAELALAARGLAGRAEFYEARAMLERRMGAWEQSLADFGRAVELDPRNVDLLTQQANTYLFHRDYAQAERSVTRALDIEPDNAMTHNWRALVSLYGDGDVTLAKALAEAPPVPLGRWRQFLGWHAALYERDYDAALGYLDSWEIDALIQQMYYIPKVSYYGVTYRLAERHDAARAQFELARAELEEAVDANPQNAPRLVSLAEAMAGLGERDQAVRLGQRAIELALAEGDAISGPLIRLEAIVRVFLPAGDLDAALQGLEAYLSAPGGRWSLEGMLPDPRLDPIRDDPRFLSLITKYQRHP